MAAQKTSEVVVNVPKVEIVETEFLLLGTSPLIMNRFPEKACQQLLIPTRRRTVAERKGLPHDPIDEFRSAIHRLSDGETLCGFPASGFKKALEEATRYVKRVTRIDVERQILVRGTMLPIYGRPYVFTRVVRRPKDNVPDVRTRAIFPQWASRVLIAYPAEDFKPQQVTQLVMAAGHFVGLGDWRPEKGGSYGQFTIVTPDLEPLWQEVTLQGPEAQLAALEYPQMYDEQTAELLEWFFNQAADYGYQITTLGGGYDG